MLQVWLVLGALFADHFSYGMSNKDMALAFRLMALILFVVSFITFFVNGGTVG